MNQAVRRLAWILLTVGTVAALAEAEWRVTLACLAAGFVSLLVASLALGRADDDRYRSAVMAHRQAGESAELHLLPPAVGLSFLALFFVLAGVSVSFDAPWLMFAALACVALGGLLWQRGVDRRRNRIWEAFAAEQSLEFHPGRVIDHLDNPRLTGTLSIRPVRLEILHGRRDQHRSRFLVAEISVAAGTSSFCVDGPNLDVALRTAPEIVRQLFDWRGLSEKIRAVSPIRLSLHEESLSCHLPRIPQTRMELKFHFALLQELAHTLERSL